MDTTASDNTLGLAAGVKRAIPLGVSVFTYGVVFGVLAKQAGLDVFSAAVMSATVYAGASQFIALELWHEPLPILTLIATTFVVNLRHLLMGAAMTPWLTRMSWPKAYGALFFMADENWALAMEEFGKGRGSVAFMVGGGFVVYTAWLAATMLGVLAGGVIRDPASMGMDFAFVAAFLALLMGLWRGRQDMLPWAVAALAAIAAAELLPGKWYILIGGLAGSLAGAFSRDA